MPDRGHCLHPCWPCFQEPCLVWVGAPVPLRSGTGPSLHLPRTVGPDQRGNNKRRPCVTSRREQPKEQQGSPPGPRASLARPRALQRPAGCPGCSAAGTQSSGPGKPRGIRPALRAAGSSAPSPLRSPAAGPARVRPGPRPCSRRCRLTSARTARATSTSSASFMQYSAAGLGSAQGTLSARPPARRPGAPPPQRRYLCPAARRRARGYGAAAARSAPAAPIQAGSCRRRPPAAMPTGRSRLPPAPLPRPTGSAGQPP